MRNASIAVLREIGVDTGGSTCSSVNPKDGRMIVIEMNPRLTLVGAGAEGDRLPDRQSRRQAARRLHPGRNRQRDRRRCDAPFGANHRLRGGEDPALCI